MNICKLIMKEFKVVIRDYKVNAIMILFPIVLIVILGSAFSGVFMDSVDVGNVHVLYLMELEEDIQNDAFIMAFADFKKEIVREVNIQFEEIEDIDVGVENIKENTCSAFLYFTGNPLKIQIYKNEKTPFKGSLVESVMDSFIRSYNAMSVIVMNSPQSMAMPELQEYKDFIQARSLDRNRQPGSTDYYTITMITLTLLYASLIGFWGIKDDLEQKTAARILCAPVNKYELLAGKVFGSILVTIVQILTVILFSKFVLKTYWGENLAAVALLLLTYCIMTISLGVGAAFLIPNNDAGAGILNTIIPILVFFGGGYVPLDIMNGALKQISVISPVWWINKALFEVIYQNNYTGVSISMVINLLLAALFISIAVIFSGRGNESYA